MPHLLGVVMPKDLFCPECSGPLNERRSSDYLTCRLCNSEIAVKDLREVSDDEDESPACPACDGPGTLLGKLGKLDHYRCRNCGMEFSVQSEEE